MKSQTIYVLQINNKIQGAFDTKIDAIRSVAPQLMRVIQEDRMEFPRGTYIRNLLEKAYVGFQQEKLVDAYELMKLAFDSVGKPCELQVHETTHHST